MTPAEKRRVGRQASRIARRLILALCYGRLKKIARRLKKRGTLRASEEIAMVARQLEHLNR